MSAIAVSVFDIDKDPGPGFAAKRRGRYLHRHRHTKRHRHDRMRRVTADAVAWFTRRRLTERSFLRRIFPVGHASPQSMTLSRGGPRGSLYVLRLGDLARPVGNQRRSDLHEDLREIVKAGTVRVDGDDLVYETYDRHQLERAITLLASRGYVLRTAAKEIP